MHCANACRLDSSNWSFALKSWACASIAFLAGIISLSMDYNVLGDCLRVRGDKFSWNFDVPTHQTTRCRTIKISSAVETSNLIVLLLSKVKYFCENCAFPGHYVVNSGNFLPTFWENLSVPSSGVSNPKDPETSVRNYHYSMRNNPEERRSHLLRGGNLNSLKYFCVCFWCPFTGITFVFQKLFLFNDW